MHSLRVKSGIDAAVFHEGLSIVERDRAAAFFADSEYGSQVLICSEIGSEGRNFQFAHHLILFDLPAIPDLLEQRIGRLDRIGQAENIKIHVPYLLRSAQQIMYQWYHEGLNAFEKTCPVGHNVYSQVKDTLIEALHQIDDGLADLPQLIDTTRLLNEQLLSAIQQGRNRLLEYNSCRPHEAERIREQSMFEDRHADILEFLEACFDSFGIDFEEHSQQCFIVKPSDHMQVESFPGIPDEGMTITCDRNTALANEDIHFLTWEHPVARTACDMITSSELGNTAMCAFKHHSLPPGNLLLECIFLLETSMDRELQSRQAITSPMVRTLINQNGIDLSGNISSRTLQQSRQGIPAATASKIITGFGDALKDMLSNSEKHALPLAQQQLSTALQERIQRLQQEASRLTALKQINSHVREEEINFFTDQASALKRVQDSAKLRLDALRVIVTV
jgi:ATP-dependent helicase HepA